MYREHENISNSDIKAYEKLGPEIFYLVKYEGKQLDGYNPDANHFILGDALHTLALEEHLYKDKFVVVDSKVPSGKIAEFVKVLAETELGGEEVNLEEIRKKVDLKYSVDRILKEINTEEMIAYKNNLLSRPLGAKIISVDDNKLVLDTLDALKKYKLSNDLLFKINENEEYHNEFEIYSTLHCYGIPFKAKGKLDRAIINKKEKKAIIIDIKTTESIAFFQYSYTKLKYYRQLAYYKRLLDAYLYEPGMSESYNITCIIIAVEMRSYPVIRVFEVGKRDLSKGDDELNVLCNKLNWHIQSNVWTDRSNYEGEHILLNIYENE